MNYHRTKRNAFSPCIAGPGCEWNCRSTGVSRFRRESVGLGAFAIAIRIRFTGSGTNPAVYRGACATHTRKRLRWTRCFLQKHFAPNGAVAPNILKTLFMRPMEFAHVVSGSTTTIAQLALVSAKSASVPSCARFSGIDERDRDIRALR